MTTHSEFIRVYEDIKAANAIAMKQIDKAIALEEQERPIDAMAAYSECLKQINDVFAMPVGLPDNIDAVNKEWNDACQIIQRLKSAKTEITYRLKVLRNENAPVDDTAVEANESTDGSQTKSRPFLVENPTTCYDISNIGGTPKTYREIIEALREVLATENSGVQFDTLFQAKVKLYKIRADGVVATISGDTSMSLAMCTVGEKWKFLNGVFFIQCAMPANAVTPDNTPTPMTSKAQATQQSNNLIWIYPLVPAVTACYRTEYGAYILPDLESNDPGASFGLMLINPNVNKSEGVQEDGHDEDEEFADVQQFFLDLLEAVLAAKIEELKHVPYHALPSPASEQISKHIVTAADFIARNLVRGAEKTGELMVKSTPYIISRLRPAPADAPPVSSAVQNSVEVAKSVTSAAAGVTGWVAGKVGSASLAVGRYLAPHIQTQGAVLLEKGFGYDSHEANTKMEGALTIAAGAVEGLSTVYTGLETSARILGTNLSDNSVKIIEHKYGSSAGNVAAGTFDTIGNAFNVSQNVNYMTPKGIAKKLAKTTGKAMVDDYKRNLRSTEAQVVPAGLLYPDLRALKEKQ